jgi:hypothetical protein
LLRRIWPAVPNVARLIVLALVLANGAGTSAPDIRPVSATPGLERLDPQQAAITHRAPSVLSSKLSPGEGSRETSSPGSGEALPPATQATFEGGAFPRVFGKIETRVASVAHRYEARGPPVA